MNSSLMFSNNSDQHYTPYIFIARVCEFFGDIDLDPCANSLITPHVPSLMKYTKEIDGLKHPWYGRVFVNPPYSNIQPFLDKTKHEYVIGNITECIVLVPARTDTKWHQSMSQFPRCYIYGRLKFVNEGNKGNSAPFPSMLFYLGERVNDFQDYWCKYGEVFIPSNLTKRESETAAKLKKREYMREYMRNKRSSS